MSKELLKYIPFTKRFNEEVLKRIPKEDIGLLLIILLIFTIVLLCSIFGVSWQLVAIILGGFFVIIVYLLTRKPKKSKDEDLETDKEIEEHLKFLQEEP